MATHKLMEITSENVYVVVTRDDGTTFGKIIPTQLIDRSSLAAMRNTIRREAYKTLTETPPVVVPVTDLVVDVGVDQPCVADPAPVKPDANQMEADMNEQLSGVHNPLGYGKGFDVSVALRAIIVELASLRNGVLPGALTPAQIATERARFVAVYKALP